MKTSILVILFLAGLGIYLGQGVNLVQSPQGARAIERVDANVTTETRESSESVNSSGIESMPLETAPAQIITLNEDQVMQELRNETNPHLQTLITQNVIKIKSNEWIKKMNSGQISELERIEASRAIFQVAAARIVLLERSL